MRNNKTSHWMTVTLRDDQGFSVPIESHRSQSFSFGNIYNARLRIDRDNNFILGICVMLEEQKNFDRITRLYKQFSVDLLYPNVQAFLNNWDIIDRRVLIEKTGHYL